jgi:hypothetical protein
LLDPNLQHQDASTFCQICCHQSSVRISVNYPWARIFQRPPSQNTVTQSYSGQSIWGSIRQNRDPPHYDHNRSVFDNRLASRPSLTWEDDMTKSRYALPRSEDAMDQDSLFENSQTIAMRVYNPLATQRMIPGPVLFSSLLTGRHTLHQDPGSPAQSSRWELVATSPSDRAGASTDKFSLVCVSRSLIRLPSLRDFRLGHRRSY